MCIEDKGQMIFFNTTEYGLGCQGMLLETKKSIESNVCFINGLDLKLKKPIWVVLCCYLGLKKPVQIKKA